MPDRAAPPEASYRVWHPWTRMTYLTRDSRLHLDIVSAADSSLFSADGFRFIDASAGLWNVSVGHGRPEVVEAVAATLTKLTYQCNIEMRSEIANDLANRLLTHLPGMSRVRFHCTGTAAVEGAVLTVRQFFKMTGEPERFNIIAVNNAYHGGSLLATALSGLAEDRFYLEPLPTEIYRIGSPDDEASARASLDELAQLIDRLGAETIACFVFEPIMGVAGVVVPPDWWTRGAVDLCRSAGIKVIADEVTTGLGRTGVWYATAELPMDVVVLGKGISGGYMPLAASVYTEELFSPFNAVDAPDIKNGSTMDGFPAACAAGMAVLDIFEREQLVERARKVGGEIRERLRGLEELELVGRIRGRGMMLGIPLVEPRNRDRHLRPLWVEKVIGRLLQAGVLTYSANSTISVLPPLTMSADDIETVIRTLGDTLTRLNRKLKGRGAYSSTSTATVARSTSSSVQATARNRPAK